MKSETRNQLAQFVHSAWFANFIVGVIVLNAVLIGVETYMAAPVLRLLERICVAIFIAELTLKFIFADSRAAFLRDRWNLFDIVIVGSALVPSVSGAVSALRILRVLRVLRLVNSVPELRLIITVLARSISSMTYIGLLMLIVFYVYAVAGVVLFGQRQPEFANLHEAFFTLFRLLTADNWTDLRYASLNHANWWLVTLYYISWIVFSTFLLINLLVGAIINNYQEVQEIEQNRHLSHDDQRILELTEELNLLLRRRMAEQKAGAATEAQRANRER